MRCKLRFADFFRPRSQFAVWHQFIRAIRTIITDEDDTLEVWQSRLADRADFAEHADVIHILEAANSDERGGLALAQQVVNFMRAQRGVDRDKDRTDLGQRELEHDP